MKAAVVSEPASMSDSEEARPLQAGAAALVPHCVLTGNPLSSVPCGPFWSMSRMRLMPAEWWLRARGAVGESRMFFLPFKTDRGSRDTKP